MSTPLGPGMGGLPPRRVDQVYDPSSPALPTGAQSVFRGRLVIISGTAADGSVGLFAYAGTPGLGNLIGSIAATAGTDPYGNAYVAGITSYTGSAVAQLFAGTLRIYTVGDNGPMVLSGAAGVSLLRSGTELPGDTGVIFRMSSADNTGTNPQLFLSADDGSLSVSNRLLEVAGNITLQGSVRTEVNNIEETTHSLSGFATGFSVGGEAHYRLCASPPNTVQIALRNIAYNGTGTNTDGATILSSANGLPPSYRPSTAKRLVCSSNLLRQPSTGVFEACSIEVETDGSLQIFGMAAGATRLDLHALYPTDM